MVTRVYTKVWDDLHYKEDAEAGEEPVEIEASAAGPLHFFYEGVEYEIDLSSEHLKEYADYMGRLVKCGRKVETHRAPNGSSSSKKTKPRGRASATAPYRERMRQYFESIGEPIPAYKKKGTDKPAGYGYRKSHWDRFAQHLRDTGRENEIMEFVK